MDYRWHAVIMAGGAGTRFWPASRRQLPKQFLPLGHRADETLIQATVRRLLPLIDPTHILIATGAHLVDQTLRAVPEIPRENILLEPVPRNTAPCIGWAASRIRQRDPQAVVAVFSADHAVSDEATFIDAIREALSVASTGIITTVGIVPTRPETGYGYIEMGEKRSDGAYNAVRFVEKPTHQAAEAMLSAKRFLWNAGYFFFPASTMLEAFAAHLPNIARGISEIEQGTLDGKEDETVARVFPTLEAISIDYGIMEKVSPLAVVPASFGWSDVGSWQTAWEMSGKDSVGNVAPLDAVLVDSRNNLVANWSSEPACNKVIALLGVEDLAIVETDDALLVMPRSRSQDVRLIVAQLAERRRNNLL